MSDKRVYGMVPGRMYYNLQTRHDSLLAEAMKLREAIVKLECIRECPDCMCDLTKAIAAFDEYLQKGAE